MNTMNSPKAVDMWKTLRVSHISTATSATTIYAYAHKSKEKEDISNGLNQRTFLSGLDTKTFLLFITLTGNSQRAKAAKIRN